MAVAIMNNISSVKYPPAAADTFNQTTIHAQKSVRAHVLRKSFKHICQAAYLQSLYHLCPALLIIV